MRVYLEFVLWWDLGELTYLLIIWKFLSSLKFCVPFSIATFDLRVGGLTVPFDIFAEFLPTSARLVCMCIDQCYHSCF